MGFNSSQLVFAPNTGHSLKPIFLFFDFCRDSTSYMSVTTGLFSSTKSQLKTSLLYRPTGLKNRRCSALDQILMVQKFQEVVFENESSRSSKMCFSVSTGLTAFMRVTFRNHIPRQNDAIQFAVNGFSNQKLTLPKLTKLELFSIDLFEIQSHVSLWLQA